MVDALGNPLRFILTPGQRHDLSQGADLIDGYKAEFVVADKGYDAPWFIEFIEQRDAQPVVPSRKCNKEARPYDKHIYKQRSLVECFVGKLKHYRRVFSRFDKLDSSYFGFLSFAAALIWLR